MKIRRLMNFLVAVSSLVVISAPVIAAEPLNRIVAYVNDEVITLHELNTRIKEVTGMTPVQLKSTNEEAFQDTRKKILEYMIDEKITEAKVRELNIRITQKQLDEAVERIKSDNRWTQEDLLEALRKEGLAYDRFREKVKRDLERIHLINSEVKSKIIITEERIRKYYEENKAKYAGDGKVHLAGIVLIRRGPGEEESERLRRKGEEILQLLKGGEDFGGLAKRYSEGPGADEGGEIGTFKLSQLDPELQKILKDIAVGGHSGLIERRNGIQIIKLLGREGGEERDLSEVKDAIFSAIYQDEVNSRYTTWIRELREKSYTKIIF
jgi:peptidyl-prolyl cis-trans isomerase SurA